MAETPKILGQSAPVGQTDTTAYTVPSSTHAVVSTAEVCNRGTSDTVFRLSLARSGQSTELDEQYLYFDHPIYANKSFGATIGIALEPGDVVRVYAGNGNLSFTILGVEIVS